MSEQSLKLGFIMGLLCPSEKRVEKEPVAYLYNGVRLPYLDNIGGIVEVPPTLSTHPYRCIIENTSNPIYVYMLISTAPLYFDGERLRCGEGNSGWSATSRLDEPVDEWYVRSSFSNLPLSQPISGPVLWSNYTIKDADGNEYYAKSDLPIPVYE